MRYKVVISTLKMAKERSYIQILLSQIFFNDIDDKQQTRLCLFLVYYIAEIRYLRMILARKMPVAKYKSSNKNLR